MKRRAILNLGAGKVDPADYPTSECLVCVDSSYANQESLIQQINNASRCHLTGDNGLFLISSDIFTFLDRYPYKFDHVIAYRIFEHFEYVGEESIGRLFEALNKITKPSATMDIIVPNADLLAERLNNLSSLTENTSHSLFANEVLLLNTEFTNPGEGGDCHRSVWSPLLARYYVDQEGTWKIVKIEPSILYASRDIYMRILLKK